MRWRQFFTPVRSLSAREAKEFMDGLGVDEYNLVDVRQAKEYEAGHIAGAKLVPVAELADRLDELDPGKPTIVY